MDMNVDLELEMKISDREVRLLLLHQFRLSDEATSNRYRFYGQRCALNSNSTALLPSIEEWQLSTRPFISYWKSTKGEYRPLKAAYRRRSSIDYTVGVFSRVTSMLWHCSGNTSAPTRQNLQMRSFDATRIITASAAAQACYLYRIIHLSSWQLLMAPQSSYWQRQLGAVHDLRML